jgi:hypothetical protein
MHISQSTQDKTSKAISHSLFSLYYLSLFRKNSEKLMLSA